MTVDGKGNSRAGALPAVRRDQYEHEHDGEQAYASAVAPDQPSSAVICVKDVVPFSAFPAVKNVLLRNESKRWEVVQRR